MEGAKLNPAVQLFVGGVSGATGAIATSPLEFLKTRLQSSTGQQFLIRNGPTVSVNISSHKPFGLTSRLFSSSLCSSTVVQYFRHVYTTEGGLQAFFKGLRPALIGIIPSKAVYFLAYTQYKALFNTICRVPNSDQVHLFSAVSAGMTMSSLTCPIWVLKTKIQLDTTRSGSTPLVFYVHEIWRRNGFRGFYRGLSASYAGSIETGCYFVFYERLKSYFASKNVTNSPLLMEYFLSAAIAKLVAVFACYPHEVVRTRLRQDSNNGKREYQRFMQTLLKVWKEERIGGLYGGMSLHLLRAVPNTAIIFLTYEAITTLVNHKLHN